MSAVWKFPLVIADEQTVTMPEGSDLLHVAYQGEALTVWARVPALLELRVEVERLILIRGTGHHISSQPYVGTVQHGPFVWHVFDGGEQ